LVSYLTQSICQHIKYLNIRHLYIFELQKFAFHRFF